MDGSPTLRAWLTAEPFALTLSSGFFGFFAHAGMLAALDEEGLRPVRVSGASAGALVGGMLAAGLTPATITAALRDLRRQDFWDPGPGLGLLRGQRFRRRLEEVLPVQDFAQCRLPLAVSTHDILARGPRALAAGPLATAIHASCAVPLLFQPVWLDGRPFCDGGVSDRPGLCGMPPGTRLLFHHLASRSPWRRRHSPALVVPARAGMVTLVIDGLPRVGPLHLERGAHALALARDATRRALDQPIVAKRVDVAGVDSTTETTGARATNRVNATPG